MRSSGERFPPLAYLVGETPRPRTLWFALGVALAISVPPLFFNTTSFWEQALLFLLAFDIAAGWLSNLTESTRSFWKTRSRALQVSYIVIHLAVYPVVLWVLTDSVWVWGFLFMALLGKLGAFMVGLVTS